MSTKKHVDIILSTLLSKKYILAIFINYYNEFGFIKINLIKLNSLNYLKINIFKRI